MMGSIQVFEMHMKGWTKIGTQELRNYGITIIQVFGMHMMGSIQVFEMHMIGWTKMPVFHCTVECLGDGRVGC